MNSCGLSFEKPQAVQREIRDQVLKLRVFLTQLSELAQIAQAQSRILLLPNVERGFADPVFAAMSATLVPPSAWRKARKICSSVCPFFATCVSSSCSPQDHACAKLNLSLARFSRFGSDRSRRYRLTDDTGSEERRV